MKKFINYNLDSMTFVFSAIVLLNAFLGLINGNHSGLQNEYLMGLAILIIILWGVSYVLSLVDFQSELQLHIIQLSVHIIGFFLIAFSLNLIPMTLDSIVTNGIIFIILYFTLDRIRKNKINRLAEVINKKLSENR